MKLTKPDYLLGILLTLAIGAVVAVFADGRRQRVRPVAVEEFQSLVHGIGFGPVLDLSQCEFSFDPRLAAGCSADLGPIPGGKHFCPHHACSILYYPQSIARGPADDEKAQTDVQIP
jgi:hypothetical protein